MDQFRVRKFADVAADPLGLRPGATEFDELFNNLISKKNNEGEGALLTEFPRSCSRRKNLQTMVVMKFGRV